MSNAKPTHLLTAVEAISLSNVETLHNHINLKGMKEQAFKFATSKFKGGMKQCYTKGCEIFTPLHFALKGVDLSSAIQRRNIMTEGGCHA